ncbi:MAG: insulinase family protein, partial [Bacteroidia bacterium]
EESGEFKIEFEKYKLENGLDVILHQDKSDPIIAVAIYYHVGSSREIPGKTGFAHLFEHMMFQESENVPQDQFFKNITASGGTLNGSTNNDRTNYYEVVPKNAVEVVLWMESDRRGFLTNTVTQSALVNQQNVVQNEKRQSVDNAANGHNSGLIARTLYPAGHPYSWTVIGEMEDLTSASVEDVRAFHDKFYNPGNATLSIAGDFEIDEMKALVEKYFGSLPAGEAVEVRKPMPVTLAATTKLYHEDNFARTPQLTMVFPSAEAYSKDSYALNYLGDLLSGGKKAPLYTVLVKDKKLTSSARASNRSNELAGTFTFSVSANPGVGLTEVEAAIFEALDKFEKEGFSDDDLVRIKAGIETGYYNSFSSVQGKAFMFAEYNMYTGNPEFYKKDLENGLAVTREDIMGVYEKYIKGKNYVETSFVPKGKTEQIAEGSVSAGIIEEDLANAAEVSATGIIEEPVQKSATTFDRSVMPAYGPDPVVTIPEMWTASLENGINVWGYKHTEVPLVNYNLVIEGGHMLDKLEKAGVASLMASMLNAGTANKTPEELEDAIDMLGASIRISAGNEDITISVSSLTKNFEKTLALVEEMLLEPRWDAEEFDLAKSRIINGFRRNKSNPNFLASSTLNELMFTKDNILGISSSGDENTVPGITMDDLKDFYNTNLSPTLARFLIVGDIDKERVVTALSGLNEKWAPKEVTMPEFVAPKAPEKSVIYFVDVPGAKQSVISIGTPSLPRNDSDYYPLYVTNHKLGGASLSGIFNTILREEKGFTYGASSRVSGQKNYGTFTASSMVRTNATFESVNIFKTEMEKYREGVPQEYVDFTRSAILKGNARSFETSRSLLGMLDLISSYNLPADYIKNEETFVKSFTVEKHKEIAQKYIDPDKMYYVVVGDAKTQLNDLKKIGFGDPVLIK